MGLGLVDGFPPTKVDSAVSVNESSNLLNKSPTIKNVCPLNC